MLDVGTPVVVTGQTVVAVMTLVVLEPLVVQQVVL